MNIFETQKALASCALPSAFEKPQTEKLIAMASKYCDDVYTDTIGNVICHFHGKGPKVLFTAHMDVIGFMITFIDENGYIRLAPMGGHTFPPLVGQRLRVENGVRGILCLDYEAAEKARKSMRDLTCEDVYLDIGATSREDAEKYVSVGSAVAFDTETFMQTEDFMVTPYSDDLSACCAMLWAMEKLEEHENDLYFVFTVQEEVGCKGARIAAYEIDPEFAVACDVCFTGDDLQCESLTVEVDLDKGPTIKVKDGGAPATVPFVRQLRKIAENAGIAYQDEIIPFGGTDAGVMQRNNQGVFATCISIPARGIHSSTETVSLNDIQAAGDLMAAICRHGLK